MVFQEMKLEDVKKALAGHADVIKPALEAHQQYFSNLSCYRCGGDIYAFVNPKQLFKKNSVLPNYLAKCKTCGCEFEPYTQIEVKGPDAPRGG
jgi:hypothetical protein